MICLNNKFFKVLIGKKQMIWGDELNNEASDDKCTFGDVSPCLPSGKNFLGSPVGKSSKFKANLIGKNLIFSPILKSTKRSSCESLAANP
jgi:hypothetical protein